MTEDSKPTHTREDRDTELVRLLREKREAVEASKRDLVVRPAHYTQYPIEPVEFIMKNSLPFWLGNVIKYGVRAGSKKYDDLTLAESEIRDIKKLMRYAEMRLNQLEGKDVL